jgi:hypothetical protein
MSVFVLLVQFLFINWDFDDNFTMVFAWLCIILLSFGVLTASKRIPVPHLGTFVMLLSLGAIYGFSLYLSKTLVCEENKEYRQQLFKYLLEVLLLVNIIYNCIVPVFRPNWYISFFIA